MPVFSVRHFLQAPATQQRAFDTDGCENVQLEQLKKEDNYLKIKKII